MSMSELARESYDDEMRNLAPDPAPHTPTPWELHDGCVYGPDNCMIPKVIKPGEEPGEFRTGLVALVYSGTVYPNGRQGAIGEHEANAAMIVRAVNAHDALVDALDEARAYIDKLHEHLPEGEPGLGAKVDKKIVRALKLAGVEV